MPKNDNKRDEMEEGKRKIVDDPKWNEDGETQDMKEYMDSIAKIRAEIPPNWKELFDKAFIDQFQRIQKQVHASAVEKGWWDDYKAIRDCLKIADASHNLQIAFKLAWIMSKLNLVTSEIGEATEGLRTGNSPDDKIPQFTSVVAELADVIIRLMDLAEEENWPLAEAIIAKINFNATREYKHGKLA